jgi:hypothetical protein
MRSPIEQRIRNSDGCRDGTLETQESFPEPRPAYRTTETAVYRLEGKKAICRVRSISKAHIFEPTILREFARHCLPDEILSFFGGRAPPRMARPAETGRLTTKWPRCRHSLIGPLFS